MALPETWVDLPKWKGYKVSSLGKVVDPNGRLVPRVPGSRDVHLDDGTGCVVTVNLDEALIATRKPEPKVEAAPTASAAKPISKLAETRRIQAIAERVNPPSTAFQMRLPTKLLERMRYIPAPKGLSAWVRGLIERELEKEHL